MYKFICHDNKYESYEYVETKTFQPIHGIVKENPKETKLFMNDVFDYQDDKFCLVHSNIRSNKMIPGILDLQITHGKEKQKFLYLCKPDDKRIPFFLIPYQNNSILISLSRKYILHLNINIGILNVHMEK